VETSYIETKLLTDAANPTRGEARNVLISMILNETLEPF